MLTIQTRWQCLRVSTAKTVPARSRRTFKLQTPLGEGLSMANRAALLKKIQARKAEKVAAYKSKWAKMRHMADEGAGDVEKSLSNLAESCAAQAESFENLREKDRKSV